MNRYFILNKPYGFLSQFTDGLHFKGLMRLINVPKDVYAVGRLDADSEGLLILTNDTYLTNQILDPQFGHIRTYSVQIEGVMTECDQNKLKKGVEINNKGTKYQTLPAKIVQNLTDFKINERNPPIRFRKHIPTSWIKLSLIEGKNRQVRKMTAAVGYPTLRLVRTAIEGITLEKLESGRIIELPKKEIYKKLKIKL